VKRTGKERLRASSAFDVPEKDSHSGKGHLGKKEGGRNTQTFTVIWNEWRIASEKIQRGGKTRGMLGEEKKQKVCLGGGTSGGGAKNARKVANEGVNAEKKTVRDLEIGEKFSLEEM